MDIRNGIIASFKEQYGFAPAKKDLLPMEASGFGSMRNWEYEWVAFCVNGIGYEYDVSTGIVEKNQCYDFVR